MYLFSKELIRYKRAIGLVVRYSVFGNQSEALTAGGNDVIESYLKNIKVHGTLSLDEAGRISGFSADNYLYVVHEGNEFKYNLVDIDGSGYDDLSIKGSFTNDKDGVTLSGEGDVILTTTIEGAEYSNALAIFGIANTYIPIQLINIISNNDFYAGFNPITKGEKFIEGESPFNFDITALNVLFNLSFNSETEELTSSGSVLTSGMSMALNDVKITYELFNNDTLILLFEDNKVEPEEPEPEIPPKEPTEEASEIPPVDSSEPTNGATDIPPID